MQRLSLCLLLFLNFSCASTAAEYVPITLSAEEEIWDFCTADLHGPDVHRQGLCYLEEQCKKGLFQSHEKVITNYYAGKIPPEDCRRVRKFCAWGDMACMDAHKMWSKVIYEGM